MASNSILPAGCSAGDLQGFPASALRHTAASIGTRGPDDHSQSEVGARRCRGEVGNCVISAGASAASSTRGIRGRSRGSTKVFARRWVLMATPSQGRQIAVVPLTEGTSRLTERLAPRCALAGIEISLVGSRDEVMDVKPAETAERVAERIDE